MTFKILLVDNNRNFLGAVTQAIELLPGTLVVGQASDGGEALSLAHRLQPDLMLLDIAMPVMNGLDVARSIRGWASRPRIVFLSMHGSTAYRNVAKELGAEAFVEKADFVTELIPIIERLCAQKIEPVPLNRQNTTNPFNP